MSKLQDWCNKILPLVKEIAEGGVVQYKSASGEWIDKTEFEFLPQSEYRIKPRTIKIGDFDVPEPMRVEPESDAFVYCATPHLDCAVTGFHWTGNHSEKLLLRRGMIHASTESAKIHAGAIISLTAENERI